MGVLKNIFGPSRDEIWQQFSEEIGAKFVEGGIFKRSRVEAKVNNWTIVLDLYSPDAKIWFTRMRAPYINKDGFRFAIYEVDFFKKVGKLFGAQDIEVGSPDLEDLKPMFGTQSYLSGKDVVMDPKFDENYIIQGNYEEKVKSLFRNLRVRQLIKEIPNIHFEVLDDGGFFSSAFPEGVDQLKFQVLGEIKDLEQLKSIYHLFAETLNHLCHIGSAYEDDPNFLL
ncbi:MAG: DUF3137 domain-containing protein [Acidobacteria bacterium]|nr:DUF3137 domain-containing protein [Acidobacteriota bacterium]